MINVKQFGQTERVFGWVDFFILAFLISLVYVGVMVAKEWTGPVRPVSEIHLEAKYLPVYALFSLTRGFIAYGISFLFTMIYGYGMARGKGTEKWMLPLLDILQSIPVLGFLPGLVLGLIHLFPHQNLGLEMASILMIFTGQVWNMTFSFYSSLKSVPHDLVDVCRLTRLTWWERFLRLDLSFAASGLVWNSMMSMAGGWFFLIVSEAFVLGKHDFRLPGLGAFMSVAIEQGNVRAQILGLLAMLLVIVCVDQVVWRPLVAWSTRFSDDKPSSPPYSWLWERIRKARIWQIGYSLFHSAKKNVTPPLEFASQGFFSTSSAHFLQRWLKGTFLFLFVLLVLVGMGKYLHLLSTLSWRETILLFESTVATFARVMSAVTLATLWTVPLGVYLSRRPSWSQRLQPMIQMAASFPAPMIFPLVVGWCLSWGIGLGWSSVLLLLLGTQWYVLFNVMAGASNIPQELWEVSDLLKLSRFERWRKMILPSIFPHLLTGWISATGGAWNATIVAEYMKHQDQTLTTLGLGGIISQATEAGNFHILAGAVGIMSLVVVGFNRLVWRPLSHIAQSRPYCANA